MKYQVETTQTFDRQKDRQAVRAIVMRIARAEAGNLGDVEPVGEGVSEMRIFVKVIAFTLQFKTIQWFCY